MSYTNITPKTENITGASLSGTTGTAGRTYTLVYSGVLSNGVVVVVDGTSLAEGASYDFVLASGVITFNNIIDNTQIIRINYFITSTVSSSSTTTTTTSLRYATPIQLASILNFRKEIPSWEVGYSPVRETVGTGDNSTLVFYLDHRNILSDSYTLYYGSTAAATTTLTETTHYSLDCDSGKITLTTTGRTLLATNNIYAEYDYSGLDVKTSYLIEVLGRAESILNKRLNTYFTNGDADNPAYPAKLDIQISKGIYNRIYFTDEHPIIDVTSALAADLTAAATSLTLTTGHGVKFPSSGYIIIDREIIYYTGISTDTLTGLVRGSDDSTAATHSSAAEIHTTCVSISGTEEGSTPAYYPLAWDSEVTVDDNGKIYIYQDQLVNGIYVSPGLARVQDVADRFRVRYLYGWDSIPVDIVRATLLLAKKMLMSDTVGSSLIKGRDEFRPEILSLDNEELDSIMSSYKTATIINT